MRRSVVSALIYLTAAAATTAWASAPSAEQTERWRPWLQTMQSMGCMAPDALLRDGTKITVHPLKEGLDLVVAQCFLGAYQSAEHLFLDVAEGDFTPEPHIVPLYVPSIAHDGTITAKPLVGNGVFDPETKMLSTYSKGRGLGDCGSAADYALKEGTFAFEWSFALVQAWDKPDCDETLFEPTNAYRIYPKP